MRFMLLHYVDETAEMGAEERDGKTGRCWRPGWKTPSRAA